MTQETPTNPVEGDVSSSDAEVDTFITGDEQTETDEFDALNDDGQAEAAPEVELEEIDWDGAKYQVPKAIKPALMMQADYTRKTQELADQRKAVEAQAAKIAETDEGILTAAVDLKLVEQRIAAYRALTPAEWSNWAEQDYGAAQRGRFEYDALKDQRDELKTTLTTKTTERQTEAQRAIAKQIDEGNAVLNRDIKGWGQELAGKLEAFAISSGLFTAQEAASIADPKIVKLLHRAYVGDQAAQKQAKAEKLAKAQGTQPAQTLRGNNGQFAPAPDTTDFAAFEKLADAAAKKRA